MGAIAKCANIKDHDVTNFMKKLAMLHPSIMRGMGQCSIQVAHCTDVKDGSKCVSPPLIHRTPHTHTHTHQGTYLFIYVFVSTRTHATIHPST